MSNIEDPFPVPKSESFKEESTSESSPELEEQNLTREPSQVVKKKRGRKPIKISSEERKERNREAQVAFRRRKAYRKQSETIIKQLKETLQSSQQSHRSAAATIKQLEETLQSSKQSHRSAADECLMFRYKNSLLERILVDKGINVQAELKLNRNRRSQSTLESGSQTQRPSSSQAPSNNFTQIQQISPRVAQQQRQSPPPQGVSCVFPSTSPSNATATDGGRSSEHSNPSYKLHLEQLEEEEEKEHATMFYDEDPSDDDEIFNQQQPVPTSQQMPTGIQRQPPMEQMQSVQPMPPMQPIHPPPTSQLLGMSNPANSDINLGFDGYDPMLDLDPFGFTASMDFPTDYTSVGWR